MTRVKAMTPDERVVARWRGPAGGLLLVEGSRYGTRLLQQNLAGNYKPVSIVAGRKANGGAIYSPHPSLEHAAQYAKLNNYERIPR